jgi:5-methylcytosine-specific restriction endonuclease McrA
MTAIPADLRRQVIIRAYNCCEYCLLPDNLSFYPHEIDHIVAEKHGGETQIDNLAFSCWFCNRHKGSDLTSIDPETRIVTLLFNPRTQN